MKIVIVLLAIGAASAGRLENVYLPAGTAGSAGGAGLIKAPGFGAGGVGTGIGTGGASSGGYYSGNQGAYQGGAGQHGQFIEITRYNNDNNGDGSYQYNYETANGISVEESGALQGDGEAVRGSYSYTGPDGAQYTVHYTADENGFHPEGAHLPTPPPIPEEIRRGVELSLAAEARGENQDGQYRAEPQGNYNRHQAPSTGNSGYRY